MFVTDVIKSYISPFPFKYVKHLTVFSSKINLSPNISIAFGGQL